MAATTAQHQTVSDLHPVTCCLEVWVIVALDPDEVDTVWAPLEEPVDGLVDGTV